MDKNCNFTRTYLYHSCDVGFIRVSVFLSFVDKEHAVQRSKPMDVIWRTHTSATERWQAEMLSPWLPLLDPANRIDQFVILWTHKSLTDCTSSSHERWVNCNRRLVDEIEQIGHNQDYTEFH